MSLVEFAELLADQADLNNPGVTYANNVVPLARGYGPFYDLTALSGALTARCQGAFPSRDKNANIRNFAADAAKVYLLDTTTNTYLDVSPAGGLHLAEEIFVEFCQFAEVVIATGYNDAVQAYTLNSSSIFAALAASAPQARHIAIIGQFVFLGDLQDGLGGVYPYRVAWSPIGNPSGTWIYTGTGNPTTQADYQDIESGNLGAVQRIISGAEFGYIILERGIVRVAYVGTPVVWQFDRLEGAIGTPCPYSVVPFGNGFFYIAENGPAYFDGSTTQLISTNKVAQYFFSDINQALFTRVTVAIDPTRTMVIWGYRNGTTSGNPNRLMICNYGAGFKFSFVDMNHEMLCNFAQQAYTVDQLDAIYGSIDTLPGSLDSRVYANRRLLLGAFDTTHKLGLFTGSALAATLDTAEITAQDGQRIYIDGIRPVADGGTLTVALRSRDTPTAALTTGSDVSPGDDGICPFNLSTRYARARVKIAAGGTWNNAVGVEPYFVPDGFR